MKKILQLIDTVVTSIGTLALLGLIGVAFIQVFFRYVLNNALPWPEEICRFTFIILAYTGMIMTMRSDGHLRVDVALSFASDSVKKFLNVLTMIASIAYCALATYYTYDMLLNVKDMEQMASTVDIAIYITWIPIPVGFALTGVAAVIQLISLFTSAPSPEESTGC